MLEEVKVVCPYCGESFDTVVDPSVAAQDYIEDCAVCCRPITFVVRIETGGVPVVEVWREDE